MTDHPHDTPAPAMNRPAERPPGWRWRRLIVLGVLGVALFFASLLGVDQYRSHVAEQELQDAIAEADRLDPGWRIDELQSKRAGVPAKVDSVVYIDKAGRAGVTILNTGTNRQDLIDARTGLENNELIFSPIVRLTGLQTAALRAALKPQAAPLADARKIADLPKGRCSVFTTLDITLDIFYGYADLSYPGTVVWLLGNEALLRIEDGDADEAWVCCRAILNTARCVGDEPDIWAQNFRRYCGAEAIRFMERTLAQGHVAEKELAQPQGLLQEELKHPGLLIGLRGERAHLHSFLTRVEAGRISAGKMKLYAEGKYGAPGIQDEVQGYLARHEVKPAHAWLLRHLTHAVEITKQSGSDTDSALRKLHTTVGDAPPWARKLALTFDRIAYHTKYRPICGCACAGLAAERYRLQHDRWPETLADLVAEGMLDEVPTDPYDGKPLCYRTTRDGIVIYSVGPNGEGRGDALDGDVRNVKDDRLEFRLWDTERR